MLIGTQVRKGGVTVSYLLPTKYDIVCAGVDETRGSCRQTSWEDQCKMHNNTLVRSGLLSLLSLALPDHNFVFWQLRLVIVYIQLYNYCQKRIQRTKKWRFHCVSRLSFIFRSVVAHQFPPLCPALSPLMTFLVPCTFTSSIIFLFSCTEN